jgi:hypothetical protein
VVSALSLRFSVTSLLEFCAWGRPERRAIAGSISSRCLVWRGGGVGGLLLAALFATVASLGWGDVLVIAPSFAFASAAGPQGRSRWRGGRAGERCPIPVTVLLETLQFREGHAPNLVHCHRN